MHASDLILLIWSCLAFYLAIIIHDVFVEPKKANPASEIGEFPFPMSKAYTADYRQYYFIFQVDGVWPTHIMLTECQKRINEGKYLAAIDSKEIQGFERHLFGVRVTHVAFIFMSREGLLNNVFYDACREIHHDMHKAFLTPLKPRHSPLIELERAEFWLAKRQ